MIKKILKGPAGNLETVVEEPSENRKNLVAIICHPHPLHEGTMNNKVVTTLSRVFTRLGATAIRFNFRGVGLSEGEHAYGVGELDDLRAIIHWVHANYRGHRLLLAGFSFGSYIATKVATEVHPVALVTVAPPVHHNDFASLPPIDFPWIVVQGEADEVVPPQEVFTWLDSLTQKPDIIRMPGIGHFFHGKLIPLRDLLIAKLQPILTE